LRRKNERRERMDMRKRDKGERNMGHWWWVGGEVI
jgi:hypothetical protein